jgi:hypothetical protein
MLFFSLIFAGAVAAVLLAEKLDIECVNPPAPKRFRRKQKTASRGETSVGLVPGGVFLRQQ